MLAPKAAVCAQQTPILSRAWTGMTLVAILIVALLASSALHFYAQPKNVIVGSPMVPQGADRIAIENQLTVKNDGKLVWVIEYHATQNPGEFLALGCAKDWENYEVFRVNLKDKTSKSLRKITGVSGKSPATITVDGNSWSLAVDGQHVTGEWNRHS